MLDWDKLRIFHAVAKAKNITKAGDELGLSQSAVSRQIQTLEDRLKVALFHRRSRGLLLTEQGEILKKTVDEIFSKLKSTEHALQETSDKPSGKLRVTVPIAIGTIILVPMIKQFHLQYPDIQVELIIDDKTIDVSMNEADLAIRFYESSEPNLIQRKLTILSNSVYASNDYLHKYGTPKTIAELTNHTIISYASEAKWQPFEGVNWLLKLAKKDGVILEPSIRINSIVGMLRAVKSDIGIAALPDYVVRRARHVSRILPELDGPETSAYLVYSEDMKNSRRIRAFRRFIKRQIMDLDR